MKNKKIICGIFTIKQSTLSLKNVLTNKTFKINDLLNK